jgi:F-type H+-transporting ATPase subunit a
MFFLLDAVEVGDHLYWEAGGYSLHGQVLLVTWFTFAIILTVTALGTLKLDQVPKGFQTFVELVYEYVSGIAKDQLEDDEYNFWVPLVGTLFLFIFVTNWLGVLVPWKLIHLPEGELAAPTNDINTTVALSLISSLSYFLGGFKVKGIGFFARYISPTPIFLPINILEDFTKPLSLSFRLFGNVLADEIVVAVLCLLVPLLLPLPVMGLGLFASSVQALVFATLSAVYIAESME